MIIERVNIKSFGMLSDMTLDFSPTVNVVEGRNESGKSTLAAFIKYMLYGFDDSETERGIGEREKRVNWDSGSAAGSMVISHRGKRYLISRNTTAVYGDGAVKYREDASIVDMETGSPCSIHTSAGREFLGVEQDLFENTAFIGQLGDSRINEGSVKDSIENMLFSVSETMNIKNAADRVTQKMEALLRSGGSGGMIRDLSRKRDELYADFDEAALANKKILAKETEYNEVRKSRDEAVAALGKLRDLDECRRNVLIIQDFDRLHEIEKEYKIKSDAYNGYVEENTHNGYIPTPQYLTEITSIRREVDDNYNKLIAAKDKLARERSAVGITHEVEGEIELADTLGGEAKLKSSVKSTHSSMIKNTAGIIGSGLVALAAGVVELVAKGALAGVLPRILFGLLAALGVAGAVLSLTFLLKNKKKTDSLSQTFKTSSYQDLCQKFDYIAAQRKKRDGIINAVDGAESELERAKADYEMSGETLREVIHRWGAVEALPYLNDFLNELERTVSAFLTKESELLSERVEVEMRMRELRAKLSVHDEVTVRASVLPLRRKVVEGHTEEEINEKTRETEEFIKEQEEALRLLDSELDVLKAHSVDPGPIYSVIQATDARISELIESHKACYVALDAIKHSSEHLREEISPRLGEYATALMSIMTDKKYTGFDVSDGLSVTYKTADGEDRSVDFLSGGTVDLTYVAVRMALIDMLYREKPPVVFDESFAHQDNVRARLLMRAISALGEEGYQSFIFTCRAREGALAAELSPSSEVFKLTRTDDTAD